MDSNSWLQFFDCTNIRSPLITPRAAKAALIALTRASISAQVQLRSLQTKPISCAWRRAAWRRKCDRFITRLLRGATPPLGAAPSAGA